MSMFLEHFHFLRPWAFVLLFALCWILYVLKKSRGSLAAWKKICEPALLAYLKVGTDQKPSSWSLWVVGLSGILMIMALAGPVWQQLPQPMYRDQSALVIVLDLSRSMDATDVKPSRLIRAKQKITDLLSVRRVGQHALVVFAGSAFAVTPLTEDNATIVLQLQGLNTDIMPIQGGNIDLGIEKAIDLLRQASVQHGQVVLLTDSDDFSPSMLQTLTKAGHDLSVIGVGTSLGAPIVQASGGFLTDQQGNIVIPKLNAARLQTLAKLGHGLYRPLALDNRDIQPIMDRTSQQNWQDEQQAALQSSDQWREEGPWLLLILIPLVLLGFQRGAWVVILCVMLQPAPVQAVTGSAWSDWWQTKDQQAQALMAEENYRQAEQTFENQAWKAAAAYRNQDYEGAVQALKDIGQPSVDEQYNLGNALAQLGRFDEAIATYAQVLKQAPNHQDAQANKRLLEAIEQQQNQQSEQGEPQGKSDESQTSNDDSSSEASPSQQDDGQPTNQAAESSASPSQDEGDGNQDPSAQPNQATGEDNSGQADEEQSSPTEHEATSEEPQNNSEAQSHSAQSNDKASNEGDVKPQVQTDAKIEEETEAKTGEQTEAQQAFEYQLRRVPDDPARLWRNKFKYQYQRQQASPQQGQGKQW